MKFLIVFVTLLGIVIADKEDLLRRISIIENALVKASANFSHHGLDYFAEKVNQTLPHVELLRDKTENTDHDGQDGGFVELNVKLLERDLPRLISDPAPGESMKAGGLYLSVVLALRNSTTKPSPAELKQEVMTIIAQEQLIAKFEPEVTLGVIKEHQEAIKKLNSLYVELGNGLNDDRLPTMQRMFTLEAATYEVIAKYKKLAQEETVNKFVQALVDFLELSYDLAKVIPIKNQAKADEFLGLVPKQYKAYAVLNGMVFIDGVEKIDN